MDSERLIYPLTKYVLVGPAMRLAFLPRVSGLAHVPRMGPVILAANHLAFLDSFVLPLVVPRRVHFLGKQEYFTGTGPKQRAVATFLSSLGAIAGFAPYSNTTSPGRSSTSCRGVASSYRRWWRSTTATTAAPT